MSIIYNDSNKTTIKRKIENDNSDNITSSDNENKYDVTKNSKKSRHECDNILSSNARRNDSEGTESNHSYQSKSTIKIVSEKDLSSESYISLSCISMCQMGCDCIECDANVEKSTTCSKTDCSNSDQFEKVAKNNKTIPLRIGDNSDRATNRSKKLPPAFFKICMQCRKKNSNSRYQYCQICFTKRMKFIMNRSKSKPINFKYLKQFTFKKETNEQDFNDSEISTSQNSNSQQFNNVCDICCMMPKNGLFNHLKISHTNCCYQCAKNIWKKTKICPICKLKIKSISKLI